MTIINKKLELTTDFVIEKAADDSSTEELRIRGFANTTTKDRAGDVIPEDTEKSKCFNKLQKESNYSSISQSQQTNWYG